MTNYAKSADPKHKDEQCSPSNLDKWILELRNEIISLKAEVESNKKTIVEQQKKIEDLTSSKNPVVTDWSGLFNKTKNTSTESIIFLAKVAQELNSKIKKKKKASSFEEQNLNQTPTPTITKTQLSAKYSTPLTMT